MVRFWIEFTAKQSDYLRAQSEAIERLKKAFDENGITLPFPTRTLDFPPGAFAAPPGPEGPG